MTKYDVIITRDITESVVITVDTDTREDASVAAQDKLDADENPKWEIDDNVYDRGYVTDVSYHYEPPAPEPFPRAAWNGSPQR